MLPGVDVGVKYMVTVVSPQSQSFTILGYHVLLRFQIGGSVIPGEQVVVDFGHVTFTDGTIFFNGLIPQA
jgi:hypothetical protein